MQQTASKQTEGKARACFESSLSNSAKSRVCQKQLKGLKLFSSLLFSSLNSASGGRNGRVEQQVESVRRQLESLAVNGASLLAFLSNANLLLERKASLCRLDSSRLSELKRNAQRATDSLCAARTCCWSLQRPPEALQTPKDNTQQASE